MPQCGRTVRKGWKMQSRKQGNRLGKYAAVLLLGIVLCLFAACKRSETKDNETDIPETPAVETEQKGFSGANAELVKQRAEAFAKTTAVSVGDMDISMEKAMFLIYSMEVQGNSYAAFYESQYGLDYWEMAYDDQGHTTREVFKEETMKALVQYAVLYDCAVKNGMQLTVEEEEENNAFVESLKELLSAEETERGGFTTENLRETCRWMMLGEKYYGMMTENLGITKESVRETIDKKDYKEYETEYLYLPTSYYDEDYNIKEESNDVKEACMAQMQDFYEQVCEGAGFKELAGIEERLVHKTRTFLAEGAEAEQKYKEAAINLAVGEVSEPVQTEYGIYIIRMLDDDCTKTYEATVEAEYELQRSEAFEAAYEVLLAEYEVKVNEEAWGDIILGATVSLLE